MTPNSRSEQTRCSIWKEIALSGKQPNSAQRCSHLHLCAELEPMEVGPLTALALCLHAEFTSHRTANSSRLVSRGVVVDSGAAWWDRGLAVRLSYDAEILHSLKTATTNNQSTLWKIAMKWMARKEQPDSKLLSYIHNPSGGKVS